MSAVAVGNLPRDLPWNELRKRIDESRMVLLASHVFPEADSLGSQVALALHLRDVGKEVVVCNPTRPLPMCRFLEELARSERIPLVWGGDVDLDGVDLVVILDVSDWDHMGRLGSRLKASPVAKACLDHHAPQSLFTDLDLIDPAASATGEIVHGFLRASGVVPTPAMATALYASLVFDTGCFRLRNTKDETILLAAELILRGASHAEICRRLFENESYTRLELLRVALGNLVSECDGRLAWTVVTESNFQRTGTAFNDADGILDQLVMIAHLEVGILFRDWDGGVKVTFRSKGEVDVAAIARSLGGGGRRTASGVLLPIPMREATDLVLPPIRRELNGPRGAAR